MSKENETKSEEMPEDARCIGEITLSIMVNPKGVGIQLRTGSIDDASVKAVVTQLAGLLHDTLVNEDIKMMLMAEALADPTKKAFVEEFMATQGTEPSVESDATVH
ncbi:hypothetical protein OAP32_00475 [Crocinitomicaceae bacterium]|nr:hypothetical protein [Crocinitomicaceae bacterium]